jgi:hypothetical protein
MRPLHQPTALARGGGRVRHALRIGLLAGALALPAAASHAQNKDVHFEPFNMWQTPATQFTLSIEADLRLSRLSCYALTLQYDRNLLELVSAAEGSLFSGAAQPTFFSLESDAQGRDVLTDCVLGFGSSVAATGTLAMVTFRGLADGVITVQLTDAVLRDVDRAVIAGVTLRTATVVIGTVDAPVALRPAALRLRAEPNPSRGPVLLILGGVALAGAPATVNGAAPGGGPPLATAGGQQDLVLIVIHDVAGRRVRAFTARAEPGVVQWDGRDAAGQLVGRGVYYAVAALPDGRRASAKLVRVD